jgi:hypothetical protein
LPYVLTFLCLCLTPPLLRVALHIIPNETIASWFNFSATLPIHHIQGGARKVIPLIVRVTHFYYYKNIWHLVQN